MGTRPRPGWLSARARRACAGDADAINSLVDHLTHQFTASAERLLPAKVRAAYGPQDLVQVTWIAVLPGLARPGGERHEWSGLAARQAGLQLAWNLVVRQNQPAHHEAHIASSL
jgi:hypothetical protein